MSINEIFWEPAKILKKDILVPSHYAVIILNTRISLKPECLLPLWEKASLRLTVDGGTNRWYNWLTKNKLNIKSISLPNLITGDMDSIDVKFINMFKNQKVTNIVVTKDQNETDFTKALREIKKVMDLSKVRIEHIIAVVDTAGRFDQIMANINTLFKAKTILDNINVYLLANDSLTWLLPPGRHKIFIPKILIDKRVWCSLVPIGQKCDNITTTGLKWNLENSSMKFGDLVSTSNTYSGQDWVTVSTKQTLVWSMGLHDGITEND